MSESAMTDDFPGAESAWAKDGDVAWECKNRGACDARIKKDSGEHQVSVYIKFFHPTEAGPIEVFEEHKAWTTGVDGLVAWNHPGAITDILGENHNIALHWQLVHAQSGGVLADGYTRQDVVEQARLLEGVTDWTKDVTADPLFPIIADQVNSLLRGWWAHYVDLMPR